MIVIARPVPFGGDRSFHELQTEREREREREKGNNRVSLLSGVVVGGVVEWLRQISQPRAASQCRLLLPNPFQPAPAVSRVSSGQQKPSSPPFSSLPKHDKKETTQNNIQGVPKVLTLFCEAIFREPLGLQK
jgi:hypothetical protein